MAPPSPCSTTQGHGFRGVPGNIEMSQLSIITTTTLYPNSVQPSHGIFVETRLRRLIADGQVRSQVIAPVPWVPPVQPRRDWGMLRQIPNLERRNGITV